MHIYIYIYMYIYYIYTHMQSNVNIVGWSPPFLGFKLNSTNIFPFTLFKLSRLLSWSIENGMGENQFEKGQFLFKFCKQMMNHYDEHASFPMSCSAPIIRVEPWTKFIHQELIDTSFF